MTDVATVRVAPISIHMQTLDQLAETLGRDLIAAIDPDAAERIAKLRMTLPCESGHFFSRLASETVFTEQPAARIAA